jgi:signal transduction histidine kinase
MVGAEMLVIALIMVMLGIMFIQDIDYVHRVASASLVLVVSLGLMLMKSVRSEVRQRLQIEELVVRLKEVNRILSHDVKGALGKHAMLFRALAEGEFGPVPEQAKGFIEQSAKDANTLIDSIMVILQSGHELSFHPSKFDMGNLVRDVANESRVDAEKKGLQMTVTVVDNGSLELNLDQAYIKLHVVKNLIANAINYTLQGSVDIKVDRTPSGKVLFSVKDSGVGISPEDAPHMFTEGGHGKHSTEINVHSTGYGLYSAKRIVDACGGRIWFISAGIPGEGTTFFVELPTELPVKDDEQKNNP